MIKSHLLVSVIVTFPTHVQKLNMLYITVNFSITICIWLMRIKFIHSFIFAILRRAYSNEIDQRIVGTKS
jgi:hypothetical protein